jgi:tRNA U34 5-carboxymethylaminomethyl modifying GTPase MnmE/TrmE
VAGGAGEEMIVLPLGQVLAELARLTGRGDLEEVYDRIFSSFCIGK